MRKVIGIGETVFDIIFDDADMPVSGKPGGSVYNALISLGRSGVPSMFISEVGDDHIGDIISKFMVDNGVDVSCLCRHKGSKSPLALAFLDDNKNARYSFYKDYQSQKLEFVCPDIEENDIVLFGSFFALNPVLRKSVKAFLERAKSAGAILYYDVNFRASHKHEVDELMPTIIENFDLADIVKGSDEDFEVMFSTVDWRSAYHQYVEPYCKTFICTQGSKGATVMIGDEELSVDAQKIVPISTVGAGDSFNAGTVCSMMKSGVLREDIYSVEKMQMAMKTGVAFSAEVCQSFDNYIGI